MNKEEQQVQQQEQKIHNAEVESEYNSFAVDNTCERGSQQEHGRKDKVAINGGWNTRNLLIFIAAKK